MPIHNRPRSAAFGRVALLCAAWLLAVTPSVHAAAAAPAAAELAAAEAKATEAKAFFQAKLYPQAAERFMQAYALSKRPALVYNAARAYEEAGKRSEAIALFKLYEGLPDAAAEGRQEARQRREALERALAADKGAPTPAPGEASPQPPPSSRQPPAWRQPAMVAGLSLGAVGVLAGGVLLGLAGADQSELDADLGRKDASGLVVGVDYPTYVERQTAIGDTRRLGWIGLGAGAALLAGGAALFFWSPADAPAAVALAPAAGGGRLEVLWRF